MRISTTNRFKTGFIIAITLVIITGAVSYFSLKNQVNEANRVKHSYQVLQDLEELEKMLVNMETGRRGWRATGDRNFLDPYNQNQSRLVPALETMDLLVAGNEKQAGNARIVALKVLTLDSFWRSIPLNNTDFAQRVAVTNIEKLLMDDFRSAVASMRNVENEFLASGEASNMNAIGKAILSVVSGTILVLIVVGMLIYRILKEFAARKKAEISLKENLNQLNKLNLEANERNWQLTGVSSIRASLHDTSNTVKYALNCLKAISSYLNTPAAAFFVTSEDEQYLKCIASIGLPDSAPASFELGKGLPGKAAESLDVTVVNNLPQDFWHLQSASGSRLPDSLMYIPMRLGNKLLGLIELACIDGAGTRQTELLRIVGGNIATGLYAAQAWEKLNELLATVQDQKEELLSQQEELRQTNEELTRQSEVLQASEEELRVQEEELRQINTELEEKNEAVNVAREELTQKASELESSNRYKTEFLANMSHELRTPLNSVLILANMLSENKPGNLNEKQIEYAKVIYKSGSDLLHLINDILDLSKIEAGKVEMNFEPVNASEIATDLQQLFGVVASQKNVKFAINQEPGIPVITSDRQRVEQILKNLLSNAFKFTPPHGSVTVDLGISQGYFQATVMDTGIGIAPEKQKLIFEAFQQADGSVNRKYGGTGLGLSISKELARRLGGYLSLTSREGEGSSFILRLPLESPAAQSGLSSPALQSAVVEVPVLTDDRNIDSNERLMLIIEDDPQLAGVLRDISREKGFRTVVALRGDEGLELVKRLRPSAVILDLNLPGLDGGTLLRHMRADDALRNIPVHIISAEQADKETIDLAAGFALKPLNPGSIEDTFNKLRHLIEQHYKRVLIISEDEQLKSQLRESFRTKEVNYVVAGSLKEASELISTHPVDCIVVELGEDINDSLKGIAILSEQRPHPSVIAYVTRDISAADEKNIRKNANTIVRKSVNATGRLIDELELFLYNFESRPENEVSKQGVGIQDKLLKGKKVLLADDDMRNVFALSTLLEEEGMIVVAAGDGQEALDMLNSNPDTSIILMDVMMPGMNGLEAIGHLRSDKRFKKLPVIALTAKAMAGDREKCLSAGATDYITKPVDAKKLFSVLRVWLAQ
ncbi:MAG: response regulator [Sphingobacteriales bacterium]|nr:MAG: response regulator [Sphingobacteriales bacterium]